MPPSLGFIPPVPEIPEAHRRHAQARLDSLTKPPGSLGHLESWIARLAAIQHPKPPSLQKKSVYVFAADHGVTAEGVSAYPREVTLQMVHNFLRGGAAINALARHADVTVQVVNMGVDGDLPLQGGLINAFLGPGTANFVREPAMSRQQAEQTLRTGMQLAGKEADAGTHLLATGDMGIGNTTAASAVLATLGRIAPAEVTGRGTGIDSPTLNHKIRVIEQALERHRPDPEDAMDVLAKVGGFEIGGIAGLILGAAARGLPVVVDGVISAAGAMLALALAPKVEAYLFPAHRSAEPGSRVFLQAVSLPPLLDLQMRLGEGTGAVLAINLLEAGVRLYNEMATFGEAGVSNGTPPPGSV